MTGLFVKDLSLLRNRKNAFLLFVGILILMGVSSDAESISSFLIGYGTMLFGIFAVSTMSYDEFDNCLPFLFTLPISRREYVKEKYIFTSVLVCCGWFLSFLIGAVITIVKGSSGLFFADTLEMLAVLPMFVAIISVMIPGEIKYGMEKSRMVIAGLAGVVFAVAMAAKMISGPKMPSFIKSLDSIPDAMICLILAAVGVGVLFVTYVLSVKIAEKKEF